MSITCLDDWSDSKFYIYAQSPFVGTEVLNNYSITLAEHLFHWSVNITQLHIRISGTVAAERLNPVTGESEPVPNTAHLQFQFMGTPSGTIYVSVPGTFNNGTITFSDATWYFASGYDFTPKETTIIYFRMLVTDGGYTIKLSNVSYNISVAYYDCNGDEIVEGRGFMPK